MLLRYSLLYKLYSKVRSSDSLYADLCHCSAQLVRYIDPKTTHGESFMSNIICSRSVVNETTLRGGTLKSCLGRIVRVERGCSA